MSGIRARHFLGHLDVPPLPDLENVQRFVPMTRSRRRVVRRGPGHSSLRMGERRKNIGKRAVCLLCCLSVLGTAGVAFGELVGHWKLDEGTGTKIGDSSGKGNNETVTAGNPTWITGVKDGALEFHGLGVSGGGGDTITVPHSASLDIKGPISISLWIRPDADDPEGKATTTVPMAKALSTASPSWSFQVRYGWNSDLKSLSQ